MFLAPLNAEDDTRAPVPRVQPPPTPIQKTDVGTPSKAPSGPKMERKTLDIAELKDIRFDLGGIISFHHPSTGTIYTWMAPPGEGREVVMSEFIVQRMTLIYYTLK